MSEDYTRCGTKERCSVQRETDSEAWFSGVASVQSHIIVDNMAAHDSMAACLPPVLRKNLALVRSLTGVYPKNLVAFDF
jgi:hypothetical protein